MASDECTGDRVDWDEVEMRPMVAGGFLLVLRGVARVPTTVCLRPSPIGIVEDDYRAIEVLGTVNEFGPEVETPWTLEEPNIAQYSGRVGFELVGATKREFIPPKER
jgi:hypothetical protein